MGITMFASTLVFYNENRDITITQILPGAEKLYVMPGLSSKYLDGHCYRIEQTGVATKYSATSPFSVGDNLAGASFNNERGGGSATTEGGEHCDRRSLPPYRDHDEFKNGGIITWAGNENAGNSNNATKATRTRRSAERKAGKATGTRNTRAQCNARPLRTK